MGGGGGGGGGISPTKPSGFQVVLVNKQIFLSVT